MRKTSFQEIWLNERMPVWALRFATLGMCPMPDGVATISTHVVPPTVVDVVVRGIAVVVADLHAGIGRFPQERQRHQYVHKGLASLLPRSGRVAHPYLVIPRRMRAIRQHLAFALGLKSAPLRSVMFKNSV